MLIILALWSSVFGFLKTAKKKSQNDLQKLSFNKTSSFLSFGLLLPSMWLSSFFFFHVVCEESGTTANGAVQKLVSILMLGFMFAELLFLIHSFLLPLSFFW